MLIREILRNLLFAVLRPSARLFRGVFYEVVCSLVLVILPVSSGPRFVY